MPLWGRFCEPSTLIKNQVRAQGSTDLMLQRINSLGINKSTHIGGSTENKGTNNQRGSFERARRSSSRYRGRPLNQPIRTKVQNSKRRSNGRQRDKQETSRRSSLKDKADTARSTSPLEQTNDSSSILQDLKSYLNKRDQDLMSYLRHELAIRENLEE